MTEVGRTYSKRYGREGDGGIFKPRDSKCSYVWKVITVGDYAVGKTSLTIRFTLNEFPFFWKQCAVRISPDIRVLQVEGTLVKAHIWDECLGSIYKVINIRYYKRGKGILLIYDITRRSTYESVNKWLKEMREEGTLAENAVIMLVGNKVDLEKTQTVSTEEAQKLAEENQLLFTETSALSSVNVDTAFLDLLKEILENEKRNSTNINQSSTFKLSPDNPMTSRYSCCRL